MARFALAIAGIFATLVGVFGIQPAGAVQPCPDPGLCAQLSISGSAGVPGDTVNVEVSFQQGPSDGSPGGLDEIAALALTLSLDPNGVGAPLLLADCTQNPNGLPSAITPDPTLADFNVVVQNARCTEGRTHCLCPDPASGIAPDRFVNVAIFGQATGSDSALRVTTLPSGRLLTIALRIGAGASGTLPLHVYAAWSDGEHPQSTALVSIGDDLQVDQTCAPLSKPPCDAPGSVSQLALTDGAIIVIPTPTPTITSTATTTVTASSTATLTLTSTSTQTPIPSATTTPSETAATPSPTATPTSSVTLTATTSPASTPTSTETPYPTTTPTPAPSPTFTAGSSPTGTPIPTPTLAPSATPSDTPIPTATPVWTATETFTPSPAASETPTSTPPSTPPPPCVGDCNRDGAVTVDEILTMVNIALGNASLSLCPTGDGNGDQQITIDEILSAVNSALNGC